LFKQNCAVCHGETARGGEGPNLVRSVVVLHDEKGEEIGPLVKNGRVEAGMPAFPNLSETQLYDISEYIHLQIELAANRGLYTHSDTLTSGDAEKGKVFFAANCVGCHSVTGDLAKVGAKHPQPAEMLVRIVWPSTRGPRQATVTTPSGEKLAGTLVHYDDFETTLRTAAGATTSWPTDSIKVDVPDKLAGHRALLPKYSDDDLHNLTKYLLTLK
jgi:mono/diheme cytochrome c family protein